MPYQSWHSDKAITQTNTERVRRIITILLPFRKITERKEVAVIMQYEMVNEKLKIAACSISALTLEQAKHFLELWERGATLGTLTLFYTGDGVIVLNKDNKMYSDYLEMVENYLVLSDEKREEVRQKAPKSLTETFAVVDSCIQKRAVDVELYRIGREKYPSDEHFPVLWSINQKENDVMHKIVQAFTYGMMCGKRAERVKKRRNN